MNLMEKTINEILSRYDYLFVGDDYLKFKEYLLKRLTYENFLDYSDIIEQEIKNHIENMSYEMKIKMINTYINNVLSSNRDIIFLINNILKYIKKIIFPYETEHAILNILNNFNLKNRLYKLVKNNTIDLSNVKDEHKTNEFYELFDAFCLENDIVIKYEKESEIDIDDIAKIYLSEMGSVPLLSKEEANELLRKIKDNDADAKKRFISANLRLVVPIAGRYYSIYKNYDFLDLIQEGNIALMKAVDNYRPEMNYQFTTYATSCINNRLKRYVLNNNKNVSYPVYFNEDLKKLKKAISFLQNKYLRKVTNKELSEYLDFDEKYIEYLQMANISEVSLNSRLVADEDDSMELLDSLTDGSENAEESALGSIVLNDILNIINESGISKRDLDIFFSHCNLNENNTEKLRTLAKKYNISHEAVRLIEKRVRKKLSKNEKLRQYYDSDDLYFNNKYKTEFIEEESLDKFNYDGKLKFKDGLGMATWFYKNKSKIEKEKTDIDIKIIEQYKKYIKETTYKLNLR